MSRCSWCTTIILGAALLAIIAILSAGGGAAFIGAGVAKALALKLTALVAAKMAGVLLTVLALGLTPLLLGKYICCVWLSEEDCCEKGPMVFWRRFSTLIGEREGGVLTKEDYEELEEIIRHRLARRLIDRATAAKLRKALERHKKATENPGEGD